MTQYTNRRGGVVTVTYDALSRPMTATADAKITTFAYDTSGLWVSAENDESIDTLRMDTNNRLAETIIRRAGMRFTLKPGYEPVGLKNGVTVERTGVWSRYISFGYDALYWNNLIQDISGAGTSIGHNTEHLLSTVTFPLIVSGTTKVQETFAYRPTHQVGGTTYNATELQNAFGRSYRHNGRNLVDTIGWGGGTEFRRRYLQYDDLDRLAGYQDYRNWAEEQQVEVCPDPMDPFNCYWETQYVWHDDLVRQDAFSYDAVGNRTDRGAVLNGNRVESFDGYTIEYDGDGNVTRKFKAGVSDEYLTWNSLGQLVSYNRNGTITTFGYDALGRRVRKTTGATTSRYLWDGDDLIMELDANGNPVFEYTYRPGTDRPHSFRYGGATLYIATEQPGHVSGMFTGASGVQAEYEYTPWGETVGEWWAFPQPLQFAARELDSETGLYYMRARYYDPKLGRFISEDPIGLAGGINPYVYADDNPISYRDPFGQSADSEKRCPQGYELVIEIDVDAGTMTFICEKAGGGGDSYAIATFGPVQLDPITVTGQAPDPFAFLNQFTADMMARTDAFSRRLLDKMGPPPWQMTPDELWNHPATAMAMGSVGARSAATRTEFLRGILDKLPRWMRGFVNRGRVPPGYNVDHRRPVSIGGSDDPTNMRLMTIADHIMHHRFYHPWR